MTANEGVDHGLPGASDNDVPAQQRGGARPDLPPHQQKRFASRSAARTKHWAQDGSGSADADAERRHRTSYAPKTQQTAELLGELERYNARKARAQPAVARVATHALTQALHMAQQLQTPNGGGSSQGQPVHTAAAAPTAASRLQQAAQLVQAVLQQVDDVMSDDARGYSTRLIAALTASASNASTAPSVLTTFCNEAQRAHDQQQLACQQSQPAWQQQQVYQQLLEVPQLHSSHTHAPAVNDPAPPTKRARVQPIYMREDREVPLSILSVASCAHASAALQGDRAQAASKGLIATSGNTVPAGT